MSSGSTGNYGDEGKAVLQPRRPGESLKVAEIVLKRRDRNLKAAADRAKQIAQVRKNQKQDKKGKLRIVRAEKLIKDYLIKNNDRRRLKNKTKKKQPKPYKGKVLCVVRNGRMGGSGEVKKMLRDLGITKRHTMVFKPNSEELLAQLQTCKPFLFWGAPSFKLVLTIMQKKALFRDPEADHGKTALSDNTLIEKHLGDLGLLCAEDLAHAIHSGRASKHFGAITSRLWPVPLGDAKKTDGLVHEKKFTMGDLQRAINMKLGKLIGE